MALASIKSKVHLSIARNWMLGIIFILAAVTGAVAQQPADSANEIERLMSVAKAAQEEGHYDDAIRTYRQVVALSKESPRNAALAYFNAGTIYLQFKKYDDAVNAFKQSILLEPNSADANNNLGEALAYLKQYPQAI